MGFLTLKSKKHLGTGNFEYTYECFCSPKPVKDIVVVAGNDSEARMLAQLDCDDYCQSSGRDNLWHFTSERDRLLNGTFKGVVRIKQHEGRYIGTSTTFPGWGGTHLDYQDSPFNWNIGASPRGGFFIYSENNPGRSYWQTDLKDKNLLKLNWAGDDWESFFIEDNQGDYAFKSLVSHCYVCAEPSNHSIHLIADRPNKASWEHFRIEVVSSQAPNPITTGPEPFICFAGCGKVLGYCHGNVIGAKCLFISDPSGNWRCKFCGQQYGLIEHTHS